LLSKIKYAPRATTAAPTRKIGVLIPAIVDAEEGGVAELVDGGVGVGGGWGIGGV
jgi:hypothetical protein